MSCIRASRFILNASGRRYVLTCTYVPNVLIQRWYAAAQPKPKTNAITSRQSGPSEVTLGEKIASGSKAASYTFISLLGGGIFAYVIYALYKELFSGDSPQVLYSRAAEKFKHDTRVANALGFPTTVYCRETYNRHARQQVQYSNFNQDGSNYIRVQFIMAGPHNKATVYVEYKEKREKSLFSSNWEINHAVMKLKHPERTLILEDNRLANNMDNYSPSAISS